MRTSVRIERLVLNGLRLSRWERDALGPAIARELRQLAGEPPGQHAGTGDRGPGSPVDQIAREVAASVHQATAAARGHGPAASRPGHLAPSRPPGPAARGGRR
jgi:hypothetical protein